MEGPYADLVHGRVPGTDLLATAWDWARPWCVRDGVDPEPVDRLVAGAALRLQKGTETADACTIEPPDDVPALPARDTGPRRLAGGIEAETLWLTWAHVVWAFSDGHRQAYAVLPVDDEGDFLARLDRGEHDDVVSRELGRRLGRRRLLVHADIDRQVWWHEVRPGALVPAERTMDGAVPRVSRRRAARAHRQARVVDPSP